jgi:Rieske 2Fe-2S family protein
LPTSETPTSATTLPARYYTDPDLFRICVGRLNRIPKPGDYFLREVAGESIIITRDENDSLRAFFNVCRLPGTRICVSANLATAHFTAHPEFRS